MKEDNIYDILGYLSGILFSASLIPQLYKSCKTKKLHDISFEWQSIFLLGLLCLFIYSYHYDLKPVYIPALFETSFMITLLIMKIYYRGKSNINNGEDIPDYNP